MTREMIVVTCYFVFTMQSFLFARQIEKATNYPPYYVDKEESE